MKYTLSILITAITLSSCSTIINQQVVPVHVQSVSGPLKFYVNKDSSKRYTTPTWITVQRSNHQLLITAMNDTAQKDFGIPSKMSPAFWANLFATGGYGLIVDLTNNKRFAYPSNILLNMDHPEAYLYPWNAAGKKGLLNLKISFPDANSFYISNGRRYYSDFGFLGISGGLEYYLTNKQSITATAGTLTNFGFPIPVPLDYDHRYHTYTSAAYGSLQTGFDINRFHVDYGAQFTRTYYEFHGMSTPDSLYGPARDSVSSYFQNTIGPSLSVNYKTGPHFAFGVSYYPSVYGWYKRQSDWHYSHLIFVELIFRFAAYNPANK